MADSIYRGDSDTRTLSVPLSIWSSGGSFFYALKEKGLINAYDPTDANAALKKTYTDASITGTTETDKIYTLTLEHADTAEVTPGKYLAEFQWVSADGTQVKTFAPFRFTIKGDINQRVA